MRILRANKVIDAHIEIDNKAEEQKTAIFGY